jgi:hypothetical protein
MVNPGGIPLVNDAYNQAKLQEGHINIAQRPPDAVGPIGMS